MGKSWEKADVANAILSSKVLKLRQSSRDTTRIAGTKGSVIGDFTQRDYNVSVCISVVVLEKDTIIRIDNMY